jgi:hypothetical protein
MVARRSIGVCPCSAAARRSTRPIEPRCGFRWAASSWPGPNAARCVEVFWVTLLHASERSLNVTLQIAATLGGSSERRPSGDLHARHRGSGAGRSLPFATPALLHPIKLVSPVLWALNDHGRTGKPKRSGCRMPPQGHITFRRRPNPTFQFCSYKGTSPFARYVNPGRATGPDRFEIPWRRPDARSGGVPCVRRPGTCANGL